MFQIVTSCLVAKKGPVKFHHYELYSNISHKKFLEMCFTPVEVQSAIDNFIVELNAILLPRYGVKIDSVIFDFEFYLGSCTRCKKKKVQATPAWTGLTVRKKNASVASTRHSSINWHGGSSSVTSGKRQHLRVSETKLQKGSDGKYRKS